MAVAHLDNLHLSHVALLHIMSMTAIHMIMSVVKVLMYFCWACFSPMPLQLGSMNVMIPTKLYFVIAMHGFSLIISILGVLTHTLFPIPPCSNSLCSWQQSHLQGVLYPGQACSWWLPWCGCLCEPSSWKCCKTQLMQHTKCMQEKAVNNLKGQKQ